MLIRIPEKFGLNTQYVDGKNVYRELWIDTNMITAIIPRYWVNSDGTKLYNIDVLLHGSSIPSTNGGMSEDMISELVEYINYEKWRASKGVDDDK